MNYESAIRFYASAGNVSQDESRLMEIEPTEAELASAEAAAVYRGRGKQEAADASAAIRLHWMNRLVEKTGPHYPDIYPAM